MHIKVDWREKLPLFAGFAAVFVLVAGLWAWGVSSRIAGAVVASGIIQVESNRQVIQHPEGGVVGAIEARDGDRVQAGDVLIRFDGTRLRSELAVVEGQLRELTARRTRLEAERDDREEIFYSADIQVQMEANADFATQLSNERVLFRARREALLQEDSLLEEQNRQIYNRVQGKQAQLDALFQQETLVSQQVRDQTALLEEGLTQASRLFDLQREEANIQGQIGQLEAEIADLHGQATSNQISRLQLITSRREEALTQLRDMQFQQIELIERQISLAETLSRLDVRSPVSGIVFESQVFAVQAVVQAGAPIMYIIPQDQPLIVAARIDAINIDDVYPGQEASLRLLAFDQRSLPEITGRLTQVSADVITDEATQQTYYAATVVPDQQSIDQLNDHELLPGMPVEAYLTTGVRSPLNYLTQPLMAYFDRAFRE